MMSCDPIDDVRKIAVLRANALGDFIFILPALEALRAAYPEAEIVLLGRPWHAEFVESRPMPVDRAVVIPHCRGIRDPSPGEPEDAGMLATTIWLGYEGFRMGGIQFAGSLIDNAGGVAGPIGELFPRHAAAHRADDPNELEATALALGAAGFDLYASDCAADASRSFRRHGLSSGATRCAALAQQLRERCEGAHGTDLAELTEFAALTPREKDVTLLAAKGLTNREIAEVTSTSLRTVEGHLLRAYRKLGVSSRAELASHFSER